MDGTGNIVSLVFHLYMIFLASYSSMAVFALLRFGQSRLVGIAGSLFYIMLMGAMYFQTLNLISRL